MSRPKASSSYQPFRVRELTRQPFTTKHRKKIQKIMNDYDAAQHYDALMGRLEFIAPSYMPWGIEEKVPTKRNRQKALLEVARMAEDLGKAIFSDGCIIGADWKRVHGLMLDIRRRGLVEMQEDLVSLAAACKAVGSNLHKLDKLPSPMQMLANEVALIFFEVLQRRPTATVRRETSRPSFYVSLLKEVAHALSGKSLTSGQLERLARTEVKGVKKAEKGT